MVSARHEKTEARLKRLTKESTGQYEHAHKQLRY